MIKKSKVILCSIYLIGFVFLLGACTLQKRKYLKGFYIERHNSVQARAGTKKTPTPEIVVLKQTVDNAEDLVCDARNDYKVYNKSYSIDKPWVSSRNLNEKCDTLFLKNGTVKVVSIVKIKDSQVYYNSCGNVVEEDYFIPVAEISSIHYADGRIIGREEKNDSTKVQSIEDISYKKLTDKDEKIARIKSLNRLALFFLIISAALSILLLFGMLGLYLLILPFTIISIICSFIAKRRGLNLGEEDLAIKSNSILVASWLVLLAATLIFAMLFNYYLGLYIYGH